MKKVKKGSGLEFGNFQEDAIYGITKFKT